MSTELSPITRMDLDICSSPIFIIGAPRSGTSGLAVALGQHSELWTHFESEILGSLFGRRQLDDFINAADRGPLPHWARMHGVDRPELARYIGLGFNALFTSRNPGKRWIDKTPSYSFIADLLAEMFPGAHFIHIARDGRRVVNSMTNYMRRFSGGQTARLTQGGFAASWTHDFREACRTWRSHVDASMDFAVRNPSRCLTVVNEDLAADPENGFRKIFQFIGAPYERGPVEFFATYKVNSSFVSGAGGARDDAGSDAAVATARAMESLGETQEWTNWARDHAKLFLDGSRYTVTDPWNAWSRAEREIFAAEAAVSLVKHGLASEADVRAWLKETPAAAVPAAASGAQEEAAADPEYLELVARIRDVVAASVPPVGPILVVSKGDEQMLRLQGRTGWHFPRTGEGAFSGSHPGSSDEAIAHLDAERRKGAAFLLFPQTAFWWLDYYAEFKQHLDEHYTRICANDVCIVYQLAADDPALRAQQQHQHADTLRAILVRARSSLLGLVEESKVAASLDDLQQVRRALVGLSTSFESFLARAAEAANHSRLGAGARMPFPFDRSRLKTFPDQQPIFVVGAGRSGTTAVANALREGAGYPGWVEGHVFSMLPRMILTMRELRETALEENGTIDALGIGHLDDYAILNEIVEIYHSVCAADAGQHGLPRWIDKTPGPRALTAIPVLKLVYPNARFVFMHRHPVKRALSWLRYVTFSFKSPEAAMTTWLLSMTAWQAVKRCLQPGDFIELRQSSLSLDTDDAAAQLGNLLQLSPDQVAGVTKYLRTSRPEATATPDDGGSVYLEDLDWPEVVKEWCVQTVRPTAEAWGYQLLRAHDEPRRD